MAEEYIEEGTEAMSFDTNYSRQPSPPPPSSP
jgi:hypothetical protein